MLMIKVASKVLMKEDNLENNYRTDFLPPVAEPMLRNPVEELSSPENAGVLSTKEAKGVDKPSLDNTSDLKKQENNQFHHLGLQFLEVKQIKPAPLAIGEVKKYEHLFGIKIHFKCFNYDAIVMDFFYEKEYPSLVKRLKQLKEAILHSLKTKEELDLLSYFSSLSDLAVKTFCNGMEEDLHFDLYDGLKEKALGTSRRAFRGVYVHVVETTNQYDYVGLSALAFNLIDVATYTKEKNGVPVFHKDVITLDYIVTPTMMHKSKAVAYSSKERETGEVYTRVVKTINELAFKKGYVPYEKLEKALNDVRDQPEEKGIKRQEG